MWRANRPAEQHDFVGGLLAVLARREALRSWLAGKGEISVFLRLLRLQPRLPPVSVVQWALGGVAGLVAEERQRSAFLNMKGVPTLQVPPPARPCCSATHSAATVPSRCRA